ncbi:hypothetical protein [Streptomyces sp. WMMC897]|uniref:hypothetical protein n=1 Tax=Streptomyces sp. WMMC897 TaxID=3014782 RepID=UPI0022B696E2|nr:hypothetical protein [Streptomyces sp. WMMC897]MCZ7413100.1 hypothetical protein [Streptomyces sp. WMMC897]MCZ7413158.1 hypothetical protein [Streptomyces sp. WMMC897]MCZ7415516.1 hypothetical protein [Streptomyces sp. WMMC897]
MAPPKNAPPVLENYYTVGLAAIRLGLKTQAEHEAGSKKGERWLRDGVNRPHAPFPAHRMSGQLMFSDSDLAEIAEMNRGVADKRSGRKAARRKPRTRHAARRAPRPTSAVAAA